jgi:hypothetical protein
MTLSVTLRKMLHRKSPEFCMPLTPGNTSSGAFIVSDKSDMIPGHDTAYYVAGASSIWNYNADEDGWLQLPNSGVAGQFAAGTCGEFRAVSAPGGNITNTATGGSTTTVITNLTITRDLAGVAFHVIGGTGVGYSGKIKTNTLGANAVITLETAHSVAFDATSQFRMYGGSLWFFNGGTSVGFGVYDRATNAWTTRSVTGLPTTFGTEGQLVSTPGFSSNRGAGFVNATAIAGSTSTTLATGKTWLLNQWANMQARIISGTGAGQIRAIASNTTGGVATVSAAWTVTPDATSVYRIEGNEDHFYLMGNNAVTLYRFTISTNTWATLAPTAARAAAPGGGATADWIDGVQDTDWNNEAYAAHHGTSLVHQNGRYIYSLRGGGSNVLDVYDVALNTWYSGIAYGQQTETFNNGSCSVDLDGSIYIQKEATSRIFRLNVAKNVLEPFAFVPTPQGAVVNGDKMFLTTLLEGATRVNYLYTLAHTRTELVRWLIV